MRRVKRVYDEEQLNPDEFRQGTGDALFNVFESPMVSSELADIVLSSDISDKRLILEPRLNFESKPYSENHEMMLDFRVGYDKLYVIKNIHQFILDIINGEPIYMGKDLTIEPYSGFEDGISKELWKMLVSAKQDEDILNPYSQSYSYLYDSRFSTSRIFDGKFFKLSPSSLEKFFGIMSDFPFQYIHSSYKRGRLQKETNKIALKEGIPDISVDIISKRKWTYISLKTPEDMVSLSSVGQSFLLSADGWYKVSKRYEIQLDKLMASFAGQDKIQIDNRRTWEFISKIVPQLEEVAVVNIAPELEEKYERTPLETELYVDYYGDGIAVRPVFKYGYEEFNPIIEVAPAGGGSEKILIRDELGERSILSVFMQYGFDSGDMEWRGWLIQPDEERAYDFVLNALPKLAKQANINCVDLKEFIAPPQTISVGVRINDKSVLELSTQGKKYNFAELMDIFNSYRNKRKYHRLKDGRFMPLGNQQLEKLSGLIDLVDMKKVHDDVIELPASRAMYLDELGRGEESIQLERDKRFKNIVKAIRHPEVLEPDIPESLQKILREYQTIGVSWLNSLANYGLGGILADDMGLGKTLQVITFVLMKKNEALSGIEPALVVAPTSLMYNWLEEIQKFAPELSAVAIAGDKQSREEILQDISDHDIVITTYNMLARDIDLYSQKYFSYCFLDEAQHIKNPTTQKAKAVKQLNAGGYFALTGTPIENTLTELWSIFDFIMPGYLYGHEKFKQRFETPIVRAQDKARAEDLARYIAPFVLRRLKKDVLKELPDKLERRMLNEMTEEQTKIYDAYFVQAKKDLAKELQKNGFEKSRIKILALLTRLRQIACDPAIFLEDYVGGSGKLDMLEELVDEAVNSGHRILIFSQFTQMLKRIGQRLGQVGISFDYLDGQTSAKERMRLVKSFNSDVGGNPVFLISLKAGGTGLNLTGADMVIHYDPWWNPAVEDQATDRAYRIGQQRNVQVIKLITKNTIEEQIYELQEKKKALIDQMIQPGENFLSRLTEDEIQGLFR